MLGGAWCNVDSDKRKYWGQLFAVSASPLRRFLRRRVAHAWDIEDLAQETFARILRIDDRTAGTIENPQAYLFTVASNLVKERAAMLKRSSFDVDIEQVESILPAPDGSPEEVAEHEREQRRISASLERLPPRCRAVLIMQHRDGMSYREIGQRLGVSTNMVKKYVVKALMLCRNDLMDKG